MGQSLFPSNPRLSPMSDVASPVVYRTWMCVVCGFIYDEAKGLPDEGLAPGTRWEDIPDTWTCPDCGVTKSDFEMETI
ncbi:rubredoxin [Lysobacter hankyongensis]|uniref:Rubredoxin n=2 Tax=Lysobacter hankyongensis TaxID=1176535 RepID=A0ABP9ATT9_9GAMM